MARGWESKSVEAQQEERSAAKPKEPPLSPAEVERKQERQRLQLALNRAEADLAAATQPAHRRMLETAVAELRQQLG
jgi:hypothetical protein